MRRLSCSIRSPGFGLLLAYLSGCLPFGYPTAAYIPPVHPECDPGRVHAFRVDITRNQGDVTRTFMGGGPDKILLTPLSLAAGETRPQIHLSIDGGLIVNGVLTYRSLTSHVVAVHYRPGYDLVEIREGGGEGPVEWHAAPDAAAQEKSLNDLFHPDDSELAPGSASDGQRQALLFGAAEYARLAGVSPRSAAQADKLRELAEQ